MSFILVLIGSYPDLSFLSSPVGQVPGTSRQNYLDINHFTHEVTGVSGLYAMGPLTGDNFVRYVCKHYMMLLYIRIIGLFKEGPLP